VILYILTQAKLYIFVLTFIPLLPFPLLFLAFGLRDGFSVTFSSAFPCFWAQRRLLCYLLLYFFLLSGTETASLLPFPLLFLAFGHRDRFSVTFSSAFSCFRAQRRLLCYLFLCFSLLSGTETASLLPFPLLFLVFGLRDGSSSNRSIKTKSHLNLVFKFL
jgi:hypothetical protein